MNKQSKRRIPMKTKKRSLFLIVVLSISLTIILTQCKKEDKIEEPKVIKIGAILPLTGDLAYIGQREKQALDLYAEEWNKSDNLKVNILYEDSKADASVGISSANKLINADQVNAIITSLSNISLAVQPIIDKKKVAQLAICMHPEIARKSKFTLRFYVNVWQEAQKIAELIVKFKDLKNVGFLYINTPEVESEINDFIIPAIKQNGNEIVFKESYSFGTTDFNNYAVKLKNSNAKIFVILGFGIKYPSIFNSLNANNLLSDNKIIGGIGFLTPGETPLELLENVIFVAPEFDIHPENINKAKKFIEEYKAKYNVNPSYDAAYAYDGIHILLKGFKSLKDLSSDKLIDCILKFEEIPGVTGKIKITNTGDAFTNIIYAIYKNKTIMEYQK
jgi:branched-chain amino acid transport system substrate-binding protein